MPDKYDNAIAELTLGPDRIYRAWNEPSNPLHCLFARVDNGCGCLTQIRSFAGHGPTRELTDEIVADKRIPQYCNDITVDSLPVFAEWQRRLDTLFPNRNS